MKYNIQEFQYDTKMKITSFIKLAEQHGYKVSKSGGHGLVAKKDGFCVWADWYGVDGKGDKVTDFNVHIPNQTINSFRKIPQVWELKKFFKTGQTK